ncbi:MAG TPA: carboxypeptidase regulatory-like domain-containing protein [bacterium]|jgi:DNA-binding beta-propeller fold protein YncE
MLTKKTLSLAAILVMVILVLTGGCKNPDQNTDPTIPVPDLNGVPMDPNIPEPFIALPQGTVLDIAIEGDGDIVVSQAETGVHLFTAYGEYKRLMSPIPASGLVTSNYGVLDTGRGVMAAVPDSGCDPTPYYDDEFVTGGVPHTTYNQAWFLGGEADPNNPQVCVPIASTSSFTGCTAAPQGLTYHPQTAFAYQHVFAPDCIADDDCGWPNGNTLDLGGPGGAILAYNPLAPLPPLDNVWQGAVDFLVYYDFPYHDTMFQFANSAFYALVPACAIHDSYIVWDWTTPNFMSSRDGMTMDEVTDIEFDQLNRIIMAIPNADSVAITDPVVFGQPMSIQQVLGGRQNGLGILPGEFQGPRAVAIDPRNQNILVSDSGNNRVQIFDNDGNYIREFGGSQTGGNAPFTPGALRVDAFGAIYVANIDILRIEGDDLRIYNEDGSPVQYGTIEGYVYDKDTGLPIDNAFVRVQSTFNPLDTLTDKNGFYRFTAVAAGTHNLIAEKYGYDTNNTVAEVSGGYKTLTDIFIKRNQVNTTGYGQVTGSVFSSLYQKPAGGLTAEVVGQPTSSITNGNGEFNLINIPTGDHIFRLSTGGTIWFEKFITVTDGVTLDLGVIYLPIP